MTKQENGSFANQMSAWLKRPGKKTFGDLENIFKEKSFAVAFLILMAPAALPIPTGGVTHVLEVITMLLALELIFGRRKIWSPKFWQRRDLGNGLAAKGLPKLVKFIGWFEKHSRPRLIGLFDDGWFLRSTGLIIFLLALAAILAVPFSGLDTLPAMGIVLISLALILEDALIALAGLLTGIIGVTAEVILEWTLLIHLLHL